MSTITQTGRKRGKHKLLLLDNNVKRWHTNLCRGSTLTADVRLRRLGNFCERNNLTPNDIITIGKSDIRQLDDLLLDNVTELEKTYAPSYIADILKSIRSWLSFNYVESKRKIKIKNADVPVTLSNEVVPTRAKIDEVLDSCDSRARTAICFMAFTGIRPQVMGNYDGTDGLMISDIEGLHVYPDGTVKFDHIPAKITVRHSISKAGHQYFTNLPKVGCDALAGYIKKRIHNNEVITEQSPIITVACGHNTRRNGSKKKFLVTSSISKCIREAFGCVIKDRPYVLRAYFDTNLLIAENRGKIAHAIRQFLMGHKGDMEAKYTTNKQTLPDALLKEIDMAYLQSLPYLLQEEQQPNEKSKKEMFLEMWRDQAKLYGIDPDKLQVAEKQRTTITDDDDEKIDIIKNAISQTIKDNKNSNKQQQTKIIKGEEELLSYMNNRWDLVKELSDDRFLVRYQ